MRSFVPRGVSCQGWGRWAGGPENLNRCGSYIIIFSYCHQFVCLRDVDDGRSHYSQPASSSSSSSNTSTSSSSRDDEYIDVLVLFRTGDIYEVYGTTIIIPVRVYTTLLSCVLHV